MQEGCQTFLIEVLQLASVVKFYFVSSMGQEKLIEFFHNCH